MKRLFNDQTGFSLIELLIAISLLAIGLLAMASMQGVALSANSISNRMTVSASIAQAIAEDLLARPTGIGGNLTIDGTYFDIDIDPDPLVTSNTMTIPSAGTIEASYTVETNTPVGGAPVTSLTKIDITVTRTNPDSGSIRGIRSDYILTCYKQVI